MKVVLRMLTKDMTELKYIRRAILIVSIVILVSLCLNGIESATALKVDESGTNSPIIVEFAFSAPELTKEGDYDSITMEGLYSHGDPGMPILPFKTVKILIPQGECVQNIEIVTKNKVVLDGFYNIECGQIPVPISYNSSPDGFMFADKVPVETMPNQTVYGSTNPFPGALYSEVSVQDLRGCPTIDFDHEKIASFGV